MNVFGGRARAARCARSARLAAPAGGSAWHAAGGAVAAAGLLICTTGANPAPPLSVPPSRTLPVPNPASAPGTPAPDSKPSEGAAPAKPPAQAPSPQPPAPQQIAKQKSALTAEFLTHFQARDFEAAEPFARRLIALDDWDYVPRYNLAACLAMQGRLDEAEGALRAAVERGFVEFDLMARDRNLAPLRSSQTFHALIAKWPQVQERIIDQKVERQKNALSGGGKGYVTRKEATSRLVFLSAFPEASFTGALAEIARVERFWERQVLPEGVHALSTDAKRPDPWVMVWLPAINDYQRWAMGKFGSIQVGGIYDQEKKELVTQDLGPILRHEFLHVLHWRHMMRSGFIQPAWAQEGICALVEDLEDVPDGTARPLPSWRTNTLRTMAKNSVLPRWADLFAIPADRFTETKGLANYAAARGVFLFLSERGKLREWYGAYVAHAKADPTAAFEEVFKEPIARVEQEWRAWVKALPEAAETGVNLAAILPLGLENGGDGVRVVDMTLPEARRAGVRLGDTITAIDGVRVRDMSEYARLISGYKVGDEVTASYRRGASGKVIGAAQMKLVPRAGGAGEIERPFPRR
ncbi:hypothetical protein BH11PLA1_BH11PLA1_19180 [soil metagenome]